MGPHNSSNVGMVAVLTSYPQFGKNRDDWRGWERGCVDGQRRGLFGGGVVGDVVSLSL